MDTKRKETIKFWIAILILLVIIGIVISIVIKYQVDGETNMPFELSKITIISTAEGEQNSENPDNAKWNLKINQNNDIYFHITKNESIKKMSVINSITIENINVINKPIKGKVNVYMPNSGEGRRFLCEDSFIVEDSLTYTGSKETDEKTLTIGNQGGTIPIRISNCNIGEYVSNEDAEIIHNGTLLNRIDTTNEDVKFSISFDLIITVNNIKYKTNILLHLPYENIIESGITKIDLDNNNSDWVFKRVS